MFIKTQSEYNSAYVRAIKNLKEYWAKVVREYKWHKILTIIQWGGFKNIDIVSTGNFSSAYSKECWFMNLKLVQENIFIDVDYAENKKHSLKVVIIKESISRLRRFPILA